MTATIFFADGTSLVIREDDTLTPIFSVKDSDASYASIGKSIDVYYHTHNGFIPSLMDCFCHCDFFYLNQDFSTVYSSNAIVRIVTEMR